MADSQKTSGRHGGKGRRCPGKMVPRQLPLLGPKSSLLDELEKLDIDSLTPLEAITKLYELQKKAREEEG